MHFRIMLRMTATSGFLTALECTKFVFGRCSPRPSSWFKGDPTSKGKERGAKGRAGRGEYGRGPEERGKRREGAPITQIPGSRPLVLLTLLQCGVVV